MSLLNVSKLQSDKCHVHTPNHKQLFVSYCLLCQLAVRYTLYFWVHKRECVSVCVCEIWLIVVQGLHHNLNPLVIQRLNH